MTPDRQAVRDQLYDELLSRLTGIAQLGSMDLLAQDEIAMRVADRATAGLFCGRPREVAETVIDIGIALWPTDIPHEWWATPLGRACAASLVGATPSDESIRPSVAAQMLGVTASRVTRLCDSGKLDRHPDGGVLLSSVYQRLAG